MSHCIDQSQLWSRFQILRLTQNMRVHASGDQRLEQFDEWTLSIGNGEMDKAVIPWSNVATKITSNSVKNRDAEGQSMKEFIGKIFPDIGTNIQDRDWLEGRAILCATNSEVTMINEMISSMLPGNRITYNSADELQNSQSSCTPLTEAWYATVVIEESQS